MNEVSARCIFLGQCHNVVLNTCRERTGAEGETVVGIIHCREEPLDVLDSTLTDAERDALTFLYAYMPLPDITDNDGAFFLANVDCSLRAREEMPWGKRFTSSIIRVTSSRVLEIISSVVKSLLNFLKNTSQPVIFKQQRINARTAIPCISTSKYQYFVPKKIHGFLSVSFFQVSSFILQSTFVFLFFFLLLFLIRILTLLLLLLRLLLLLLSRIFT